MESGSLNRRQFVAALAAGGLLPTFSAFAATKTPQVMRRWTSGNATLAPLAQVDGHVFFNGDQTLGCIDPDNVEVAWNVPHRLSSPAVYRPRASAQSVISGGQRELGAWNMTDGHARWLHKAILQVGTPFVTSDRTYVGDGHELLALSNQSGAIDWRFPADTIDCTASYAPTASNDTVFFGPGDGKLYALNLTDGRLKWKLDERKNWQYIRQMYVSENMLVAGTYTELLYGINIDTGKVKWTFKAGNFINSHHVAGNTAYLWSPTGWVYAIAVDTGAVRWKKQTTKYSNSTANWGPLIAEIVRFENQVYCLDMNQMLHVLDADTGQELLSVPFAHKLRPTVLPLKDSRGVLASETGEVQLVHW
jgi:outer membrane protein assembly factor BamB